MTGFTRYLRGRRALPVALAIITVALMFAGMRVPGTSREQTEASPGPVADTPTPIANTSEIQITVNPTLPGITIPTAFDGIGLSVDNICTPLAILKRYSAGIQLFKNLGSGILRLEGDTNNVPHGTTWNPTGTPVCTANCAVITESEVNDIAAVSRAINWKVIWGESIVDRPIANVAAEAAYVVPTLGSNLLTFELGNEPDLYGESYPTFKRRWDAAETAITRQVPSARMSGDAGCCNLTWLSRFLDDEGTKVNLATYHLYPMGDSHGSQTLTKLLSSAEMGATAAEVDAIVSVARQHTLALQIDESSDTANNGTPGVSDVYASSLWTLDYLFTAVEHGACGVNLYEGGYYEPIHFTSSGFTIKPKYFGMLAFHYAAAHGKIVPIKLKSSSNIAGHAVLRSDGKLRVVLINKDELNTATVQINTTLSYTKATAIRLTAPSVSATTGVTLGGSSVASDGAWNPSIIETVPTDGSLSRVTIPAASAIIITYES